MFSRKPATPASASAPAPVEAPALVSNRYGGINLAALNSAPCQMTFGERLFLYSFAFAQRPKRYGEIGTAQGGSASIVRAALDDAGSQESRLFLIDMRFDLSNPEREYLRRTASFFEGLSHEQIDLARQAAGAPFDMMLIDGDHSYEGVKRDIDLAYDRVAPGAYILLHDAYHAEIRDAIAEEVARGRYVDCGLACRHGNDMGGQDRFGPGRWEGETVIWGGLYLLRRPLA